MTTIENTMIPELRRRPGAKQEPCVLLTAGGYDWEMLFVGLFPALREMQNDIYDHIAARGFISFIPLWYVADQLLRTTYEMTTQETYKLCESADRQHFIDATCECLFGWNGKKITYTDWAEYSLLANGIDPDAVSPWNVAKTLRALVAMGKALPTEVITSEKWTKAKNERMNGHAISG